MFKGVLLLVSLTLLLYPGGELSAQDIECSRYDNQLMRSLDDQYEDFKDKLERKVKDYDNLHESGKDYPVVMGAFPGIIGEPFEYKDESFKALGISDSFLDTITGKQQANCRSRALIALMIDCEVEGITDHYTSETGMGAEAALGKKYEEYFCLTGSIRYSPREFSVIREEVTDFNEYVALLSYRPKPEKEKPNHLDVMVEFMNIEYGNVQRSEINRRIRIVITDISSTDTLRLEYNCWNVNDLADYTSMVNETEVLPPMKYLKYATNNSLYDSEDNLLTTGQDLNKGIWLAYISDLAQNILLLPAFQNSSVSSVGDNFTGKSQYLDRQLFSEKISFSIPQINSSSNKLSIQLKQLNN